MEVDKLKAVAERKAMEVDIGKTKVMVCERRR